jgi:hypothetical protein
MHHSSPDWGEEAETLFDAGVEIVEFGEIGMV